MKHLRTVAATVIAIGLVSLGVSAQAFSIVTSVAVGVYPSYIAVSSDSATAYVSNPSSNSVSVIDTSTNTVSATISIAASTPDQLALSPDDDYLYVSGVGSRKIYVIDTATNTIVNSVSTMTAPTVRSPRGLVVSPDGNTVYAAIGGNGPYPGGELGILDVTNPSTATTSDYSTLSLPTNNAYGIAISPDGNTVYVATTGSQPGSVYAVDVSTTPTISQAITAGNNPYMPGLSPDGSTLYVPNYNDQTLSIINTSTNTVSSTVNLSTVAGGGYPNQVAVSPDGSLVYISMEGGSSVQVLNAATAALETPISLASISGVYPYGIAIAPNGLSAWVADSRVSGKAIRLGLTSTVQFDSNGGSGSMAPQTAAGSATLNANSFTRSGYVFSGWNTAANGTGTAYAAGASFLFLSDTQLFAQWTQSQLNPELTLAPGFVVGDLAPNAPVTLSGADLMPQSAWHADIHSTVFTIASGITSVSGSFSSLANLPSLIEPGRHTITLYGTTSTGAQWTRVLYITVGTDLRFTYISTTSAEASLAATGGSAESAGVVGMGAMALGLAVLWIAGRRIRTHLK